MLLALLLFQSYVPAGFMPATGTPFLLELCPAAAPLPMPVSMVMKGHHHHSGTTHDQFRNCPFGSAPSTGPIAQRFAVAPPAPLVFHSLVAHESLRVRQRIDRAHPPRGPPSLLS